MKQKSVVDKYNDLLKKKKKIEDNISNLQREKDYKVQLMEKKYQSMIDENLNDLDAINGEIDQTQKYITKHPDKKQ